ncbi:MAG: bifunctional UDP-N-acetylglucosamine diphosphorylase/glucosamine-1-phosphate N-acetyltransferase GlmU [Clostridiaceae bacterium]
MYNCALILAAGEGKRMKSDIPKVLHKICGKEMVNQVIDTIKKSGIIEINVIVGIGAEKVKEATESRGVHYSFQEKQLGTGHAVMCSSEFLNGRQGTVAVFTGDAPLISEESIDKLIKFHNGGGYKATIVTSVVDCADGYGRIIRKENHEVCRIVEHKDCSGTELQVKEINSGMYCFDIDYLLKSLGKLRKDNAQGEYYLTDVIEILVAEGQGVGAMPVPFEETMGVNSRIQLSEAEKVLRKRINTRHMVNGVTLIDPDSTYIDVDVEIGRDTLVYPGNVLEGKTSIGERCILYPNSRIFDSAIDNEVTIQCSVILESKIGEKTTVGPYAYVRPETVIGKSARIGDFVEIKKSVIGDGTKVSHLTYIGDAEVGKKCNFGCGTVVVNFDGNSKSKTIIGDNAFIGCNANLISPVVVSDDTYIAAGSTITANVPAGSLAIARARQINKEGWVYKRNSEK